jgi:hypothetical protein
MDGPDAAPPGAARGLLRGRETPALLALAAGVALVFLAFMMWATDGHFVPQVVDLYLVCQYAKAMAEGHAFHYNVGEPASTGATSLLQTMVLAAAHAVGIRGEALVAFAILVGAALYMASVPLAARVAERVAGPREGVLAGALVALGGPVVWGFLYGSDIALFLFLHLWALQRWLADWAESGPPRWVVPIALLALARPEGLPLGLLLAVAWTVGPGRGARGPRRAAPWLGVAVGSAVLLLYRILTGSWFGTSVVDKSLVASYGLSGATALAAEYAIDVVRGLLLGFYPSQAPIGLSRGWASLFLPPLALVFIVVSVVAAPGRVRRALGVWLAAVGALFALTAPNVFLGVHFQRYILWAFPAFLALAAAGLGRSTLWISNGDLDRERQLFRSGAAVFVALAALSTLRFATVYGELAGDVYRRDVAAAEWIRRNLPAGASIANVATSVEYLTGHRNLNLHGVTTPAFFGNRAAEREAGAFEALERMPAAERPPYLLATTSALERFPSLRELIAGPALFRSTSFGDEVELYPVRYDLLGRGGNPSAAASLAAMRGLAEVDRLDVCDAADEAAHDYEFRSGPPYAPLYGSVRTDAYPGAEGAGQRIADGGRAIFGRESFRVHVQPGKDLVMVLRTSAAIEANQLRVTGATRIGLEIPEAGFILSIDGQPSNRLNAAMHPGWNELQVRVTGNLVTSPTPRLVLSGRYASFHYWFYQ